MTERSGVAHPLSTAERIRERAAVCRELAVRPVTQCDAREWIALAERWERLAAEVEARAPKDASVPAPPYLAVEYERPRPVAVGGRVVRLNTGRYATGVR
jgi:hypothetical protein